MTDKFATAYKHMIDDIVNRDICNTNIYVSYKMYNYLKYLAIFKHFLNMRRITILLDKHRTNLEYGFTLKKELISNKTEFFNDI